MYKMPENLPLYILDIDENSPDESGVFAVGLVDRPAIERNWMTFAAQTKKEFKFAVVDEEKRILAGYLMVADQPIYRFDKDTKQEYYVAFPAKTIEKIVNKHTKSGAVLAFNIDHNDNNMVKDCYVQQHYLTNSKLGIKAPVGLGDAPDGSWVGFVKVNNDEVWAKAKSGDIKGFSVEGYFNEIKIMDTDRDILETLKNNLINMKEINKEKLENTLGKDLFSKMKAWFAVETVTEPAVEDETVSTPLADGSGTITAKGLEAGNTVVLTLTDGTVQPIADGDYTLEGNIVITVKGEVIETVKENGTVVEEPTEPAVEAPAAMTEETVLAAIQSALTEQAKVFNAEIANVKADANEKIKGLFEAIEILATVEKVSTVKEDPKRVSENKRAESFSKVASILKNIKK